MSEQIDLTALTPRERAIWDAGALSGYLSGHEAGWVAADRDAARVFAQARRVVHALANVPEADPALAEARDRTRARIMAEGRRSA